MHRPLVSVLAILAALTTLAGCGAGSHDAVSHSLASQVPGGRVAEAPPSDFEMEFAPTESATPRRFARGAELTGSLRPSSPTRPESE